MTWNIDKPTLRVRHAELERWSDESEFKVLCRLCGGLLLVQRDQKTLQLLRFDRCVKCGQSYEYLDDVIAGETLPTFFTDGIAQGMISVDVVIPYDGKSPSVPPSDVICSGIVTSLNGEPLTFQAERGAPSVPFYGPRKWEWIEATGLPMYG